MHRRGTTLKTARKLLAQHGMVIEHVDGDYVVNRAEGKARDAYVTKDLRDAIVKGVAMSEKEPRPMTDTNATATTAKLLRGGVTRQEWERAVREGAVSYMASRFHGVGQYDNRPAASLYEACQHAADMGIERTLIYAINADGRHVLVIAGGKAVTN
jgi:hypothetical protein